MSIHEAWLRYVKRSFTQLLKQILSKWKARKEIKCSEKKLFDCLKSAYPPHGYNSISLREINKCKNRY